MYLKVIFKWSEIFLTWGLNQYLFCVHRDHKVVSVSLQKRLVLIWKMWNDNNVYITSEVHNLSSLICLRCWHWGHGWSTLIFTKHCKRPSISVAPTGGTILTACLRSENIPYQAQGGEKKCRAAPLPPFDKICNLLWVNWGRECYKSFICNLPPPQKNPKTNKNSFLSCMCAFEHAPA